MKKVELEDFWLPTDAGRAVVIDRIQRLRDNQKLMADALNELIEQHQMPESTGPREMGEKPGVWWCPEHGQARVCKEPEGTCVEPTGRSLCDNIIVCGKKLQWIEKSDELLLSPGSRLNKEIRSWLDQDLCPECGAPMMILSYHCNGEPAEHRVVCEEHIQSHFRGPIKAAAADAWAAWHKVRI